METITKEHYIDIALKDANIEQEEGTWFAEVNSLPGVLASGSSLNQCLTELKEVIDGWITVRQQHNLDIPKLKINHTFLKLA